MIDYDNNRKLIAELKKGFGFWESTAIAFIEAKGRCVYCGEDLFSERLRYYSINIDHLFPQSIFPELKDVQSNLVLSCFRCNNMKRKGYYPEVDNPKEMLETNRDVLVNMVKKDLAAKIAEDHELCHKLKSLLPWSE